MQNPPSQRARRTTSCPLPRPGQEAGPPSWSVETSSRVTQAANGPWTEKYRTRAGLVGPPMTPELSKEHGSWIEVLRDASLEPLCVSRLRRTASNECAYLRGLFPVFYAEFNLEQSLLAMWEMLKCDYWSYPDAALNKGQPIESVWAN